MPVRLWRREGVFWRLAALRALLFFFFPERSPVGARFRKVGGDAARQMVQPADPLRGAAICRALGDFQTACSKRDRFLEGAADRDELAVMHETVEAGQGESIANSGNP